jgi:hypothetical protein
MVMVQKNKQTKVISSSQIELTNMEHRIFFYQDNIGTMELCSSPGIQISHPFPGQIINLSSGRCPHYVPSIKYQARS